MSTVMHAFSAVLTSAHVAQEAQRLPVASRVKTCECPCMLIVDSPGLSLCSVEKTETFNGASKLYYARINLIDLAGSERIGSGAHGGSQVTGEHFKVRLGRSFMHTWYACLVGEGRLGTSVFVLYNGCGLEGVSEDQWFWIQSASCHGQAPGMQQWCPC